MLFSVLILAALYALHQDVWFWRDGRPLVFGFLPIGLFYHAALLMLTVSRLMSRALPSAATLARYFSS